jgi:uncharacterized membrane protein YkvA (DUF1232 family)
MALSVTLEFSDSELDYFRSLMRRIRERNGHRTPDEIAGAAAAEVHRLQAVPRSPFVARRIDRVGRLIAMLQDPEWQLPEPERLRVLDGLAYVADAQDLVPDNVPLLGLVDDAIMLELCWPSCSTNSTATRSSTPTGATRHNTGTSQARTGRSRVTTGSPRSAARCTSASGRAASGTLPATARRSA